MLFWFGFPPLYSISNTVVECNVPICNKAGLRVAQFHSWEDLGRYLLCMFPANLAWSRAIRFQQRPSTESSHPPLNTTSSPLPESPTPSGAVSPASMVRRRRPCKRLHLPTSASASPVSPSPPSSVKPLPPAAPPHPASSPSPQLRRPLAPWPAPRFEILPKSTRAPPTPSRASACKASRGIMRMVSILL
ncbi:hypothetical protein B0H14DRAFT_1526183 [Mycena olivaceomarginata]|nr:hypothetical protein B0H14DRAFT_1526183 [Mycena olivaceomarginata]